VDDGDWKSERPEALFIAIGDFIITLISNIPQSTRLNIQRHSLDTELSTIGYARRRGIVGEPAFEKLKTQNQKLLVQRRLRQTSITFRRLTSHPNPGS